MWKMYRISDNICEEELYHPGLGGLALGFAFDPEPKVVQL